SGFELQYQERWQYPRALLLKAVSSAIQRAEGTNIFPACRLRSRCARFYQVSGVKGQARVDCQAHRHRDEHDRAQRTADVREGRGRSLRTSCYSLVLAVTFAEVVQNLKHTRTAFDGLVEMKNEMRRVFQYDVPGQFRLQGRPMRLQLVDYIFAIIRAEGAHENVRALKIGGDINSINADQCAFEINFTR